MKNPQQPKHDYHKQIKGALPNTHMSVSSGSTLNFNAIDILIYLLNLEKVYSSDISYKKYKEIFKRSENQCLSFFEQ